NGPGRYYVKAITLLANDEARSNDTLPPAPALGSPFDVRYEIEVSSISPPTSAVNPLHVSSGTYFAVGRPLKMAATFGNSGVSDATNMPVRMQVRDPNGAIVYDRTSTVLNITADGGTTFQQFPNFIPQTFGTYCVT